ncbi:hypothetical protein MNBD_DELTA03-952 [hydrothermal vent metagenome]|uniref:HTH cro/C1-type domain-containing protein n=1 Tax=hydrothermal vent metagenome TaxID=652676 RepID=A0A3B0W4P2_9ZZZZ
MINLPNCLTPSETARGMADNFKALRLQAGFKRSTLARKAGVSEASLKRFETTGMVSLQNLLLLALAVDRLSEFSDLFALAPASTLAELRAQTAAKIPKRGRR